MQSVFTCGPATAVLVAETLRIATARDEVAAAALRRATGRGDISIGRRQSGRPKLGLPYQALGVSLAAREGLLLAGFAPRHTVGVDLEVDGPAIGDNPVALARDHFAAGEADALCRLGKADARDLFLRLWVAKEAALKATGRGIVDGLHWPDLTLFCEHLRAGVLIRVTSPQATALEITLANVATGVSGTAYCALAVMAPIAD